MAESPSNGEFSLATLLPVEAVAAKVEAADWREAVTASGDLLVSTGSTTPQYTQQMIAALERLAQNHGESSLPKQIAAFGISGGGLGLGRLLMSHPPLAERIAALRNASPGGAATRQGVIS